MSSTTSNVTFSETSLKKIQEMKSRYPEGKQKSALLPVLHMAQNELGGWLSVPTMDYVAELLDIKPIEVYEVATFYTMYNLKPVGNCLIEFCQTGPCCLRGVEELIEYTETKLGIKVNETTQDGRFTIKAVECLGSCGSAPMAQIGTYYYENLTKEKIDTIVELFGQADFDPFKKHTI
ncbi:MAG: NAD(P)H-dependent oxidoreductase subunit E [Cytophagaceae bacterium]|jgi:NADH-quinone oxidoreductase subunit E|nr:NAD(P)H-dependent oxidoreductase subunit E [Cytophagaceae bacterium]